MRIKNLNDLPNRRDATAINFLRIFHHNSVISATTFIKNGPNFAPPRLLQAPRLLKSRNQIVYLPITPLIQPLHHSKIRERFQFLHKRVKIKLKCMVTHTEKISFECGIVINRFENIYCQRYIRLTTGVLLIRFGSIE